jgi:hypothetical protein
MLIILIIIMIIIIMLHGFITVYISVQVPLCFSYIFQNISIIMFMSLYSIWLRAYKIEDILQLTTYVLLFSRIIVTYLCRWLFHVNNKIYHGSTFTILI